jgi:acetyl esterase/lipase
VAEPVDPAGDPARDPSISPELAAVIEAIRGMGLNDPGLTLEERSKLLVLDVAAPEGTSVEVVEVAPGVPGEWVVAPGADADRAVLHLHGGAYTGGGPGSHRGLAAELSAGARGAVLVLDYRLAPAWPFPAALDDAVAAYRWLTGPARGIDPSSLVVTGDSAGGGLAVALLVALRDAGDALPAGAALLSPWTDLALTGDSHRSEDGRDPMCATGTLAQSVEAYVPPGVATTDPRVSPLYADLSGLPPLLVHVGEVEVLRDDAVGLAERARAAGTEVELLVAPGMVHVWHLFAGVVPEATRDLATVVAWIAARQRADGTEAPA